MNRREALASLTALAGATGMTVTPVTAKEARAITLAIFKFQSPITQEQADRLHACWQDATSGTDLEGVKALVLTGGIDVEFVRGEK